MTRGNARGEAPQNVHYPAWRRKPGVFLAFCLIVNYLFLIVNLTCLIYGWGRSKTTIVNLISLLLNRGSVIVKWRLLIAASRSFRAK